MFTDLSENYIKFVNRTSRRRVGNASQPPVCYRLAYEYLTTGTLPWLSLNYKIPLNINVLDFGCGKDAAHGTTLFDAVRTQLATRNSVLTSLTMHYYDIGANALTNDSRVLIKDDYYDLVILSNVLNVQPTAQHAEVTLDVAWDCVKPGGLLILNYPKKPRHCPWDENMVAYQLAYRLRMAEYSRGTFARTFYIRKSS